jgi:hypothetical protein
MLLTGTGGALAFKPVLRNEGDITGGLFLLCYMLLKMM